MEKENTTIIDGAGKAGEIKGRIAQIKQQIEAGCSGCRATAASTRFARIPGSSH